MVCLCLHLATAVHRRQAATALHHQREGSVHSFNVARYTLGLSWSLCSGWNVMIVGGGGGSNVRPLPLRLSVQKLSGAMMLTLPFLFLVLFFTVKGLAFVFHVSADDRPLQLETAAPFALDPYRPILVSI